MEDKILFVDDELNVLKALQRQFRKQYDVSTALGGAVALKVLKEEGPFSVIVTDMQMPEMNGVQFLKSAMEVSPESVRLMLTGNADQQTAMDAVNEGSVFNFLTKPCPPEKMVNALHSAVEQYHLIVAERELLEGTVNGSVKLLMDMMSMVAPDIFGQTQLVRDSVELLVEQMSIKNSSNLKLSAMLCNLASVTLPPETSKKMASGGSLSDEEEKMVYRLTEVSRNLISNIPRLEKIAEIVYYSQKNFDGTGFPPDERAGKDLPPESRILKIITDMHKLTVSGMDVDDVLCEMTEKQGSYYDPDLFKMVTVALSAADLCKDKVTILSVAITALRDGQELVSNIETLDGRLLMSGGQKITATVAERLINYHRVTKIKEPIKVLAPPNTEDDEVAIAV